MQPGPCVAGLLAHDLQPRSHAAGEGDGILQCCGESLYYPCALLLNKRVYVCACVSVYVCVYVLHAFGNAVFLGKYRRQIIDSKCLVGGGNTFSYRSFLQTS